MNVLRPRTENWPGHMNTEGARKLVSLAIRLLEELTSLLLSGFPLRSADIEYAERILRTDAEAHLKEIFLDIVH